MAVYNHEDKIRYDRIGMFLVSEEKIIGPRIHIEKPRNNSQLYKILVQYIKEQKYEDLESLLGIKLGTDNVNISRDRVEINYGRSDKMTKYTLKYEKLEVTFEPFNKYYAFLPKATLVINTDSFPSGYDTIYYYQNNISGEFTIEKLPKEIVEAVLTGEIYDRFFKPLGISEDANISMEHVSWHNVINLRIIGQAGHKEVDTYATIDLTQKPLTIRFIGWPFVEGVYAFNAKLGEEVNLGARSISEVRKKLKNVSKKFGPPHRTEIPDTWKIEYYHPYLIKYTRDNYSITFTRENNVEFEIGGRKITTKKEEVYPLIERAFKSPYVIDLI